MAGYGSLDQNKSREWQGPLGVGSRFCVVKDWCSETYKNGRLGFSNEKTNAFLNRSTC